MIRPHISSSRHIALATLRVSYGLRDYSMDFASHALRRVACAVAPFFAVVSASAQWPAAYQSYSIVRVGLFGPTHTAPNAEQESDVLVAQSGIAAGISSRYSLFGVYNGADSWVWNGFSTVQVGLVGPQYQTTGGYRYSSPTLINDAGMVAGETMRYSATGSGLGKDLWIWSSALGTVHVGLTGPDYVLSSGHQQSNYHYSGNAYWALVDGMPFVGQSHRYGNGGGQDSWVLVGSSTIQIGPTDRAYTDPNGRRFSTVVKAFPNGIVMGNAERYGPGGVTGIDAWVWDGAATRIVRPSAGVLQYPQGFDRLGRVLVNEFALGGGYSAALAFDVGSSLGLSMGLQGSGYVSTFVTLANNGHVIGGHNYPMVTGNGVSWMWDGITTSQAGLSGPTYTNAMGQFQSTPRGLTKSGVACGEAVRFVGGGSDTWASGPGGGAAAVINPTGAEFTTTGGERRSSVAMCNDAGMVVGQSGVRSPFIPTTFNASRTWLWNGASTAIAGINYGPYTYQYVAALSEMGVVGGTTADDTGGRSIQRPWYYDPIAVATHDFLPSLPLSLSVNGDCNGHCVALSPDGIMVGYYYTYPGGAGAGVPALFAFRPSYGAIRLEALVAGGIANAGWSSIENMCVNYAANDATYSGPLPQHLGVVAGTGKRLGQLLGKSAFVMTAPAMNEARNVSYGNACGGTALAATPAPVIGTSVTYTVTSASPSAAMSFLVLSLTPIVPGLSLAGLGAPGCEVGVDLGSSIGEWSGGANHDVTLLIPNTPGLIGLEFYAQAASIDVSANQLGATTSNGIAGRVSWY